MEGLGLAPPAELSLEGNLAESWRRWSRSFANYLMAINLVAEPADADGAFPAANNAIWRRQVAILRHCIGEDAVEVLDQFEFDDNAVPPENRDCLPHVLAKFETYFNPRRNLLYEWYVFWSLAQSSGEPIDMFVKRLKTQAAKCEFGDNRDMMILCRCVFGITNQRLKEKLLQDRDVVLADAIDKIRASEVTKHQLAEISTGNDRAVAELKENPKPSIPVPAPRKFNAGNCKFCPYEHTRGKCPAYGKKCMNCGLLNHFAKKCPTAKKVNVITEASKHQMSMNDLFIGLVTNDSGEDTSSTWMKQYDVRNGDITKHVSFKIDTGAQANVLPLSLAREFKARIMQSSSRLLTYANEAIPQAGKVLLTLCTPQGPNEVSFEVVDGSYSPILGLNSSVKLGIVQRVDNLNNQQILDEFADCFQGMGCLSKEHTIQINPEIRPVINRARRIPLSMADKVKAELDRMEQNGIIEKVDQPTDWVSSMVVIEKKDKSVRICLDPRELNKAVLREHHHIPTLEDISFKFTNMTTFTIVDMKNGYWHVPLDKKSQLLTTFNTPYGRYCFKRLPFGINSAAEVFEKRVEEIFGDLDASIYFDDLIIAGRTQEEHDDNLRKLLTRARANNVKFNKDKIQHNCSEVRYLGHVVSREGLKPDPEKIQAIQEMPNPEDKLAIQRLMGTLNFLRAYIPNISQVTEPIRELLKKDTVWSWGAEQDQAMDKIKAILTSKPLLRYFDTTKDVVLQVDASKGGLGAVILQEKQPVAYASRALTETEQGYPQIDKELLAIVFGCEKFHTYVYGRPIDVQTDHQPLVSIVKKPICMASPRLQRLLIRLQRYTINDLAYVPGKYLYLADTLSRAYVAGEADEIEDDVVMVHSVLLEEGARRLLETEGELDDAMCELKKVVITGWHWKSRKQAPLPLQPYWHIRDELHMQDGFVYRGERLVIPTSLQRAYLQKIHQGHLGVEKCLARAKQSVFWPGITQQLRQMIGDCQLCTKFANKQQKMPLLPHEVPQLPWHKVAMDILDFQCKSYIVVVDFYSHYPELRLMKGKTAADVIQALKSIFSVHGVPLDVIADNMPFGSATMLEFAELWGFNITTSSPNYPKSNGMAERYVQTVKQFLKKASETNCDIYQSLLAYRQTPLSGLPFSPSEMLFNRCIRGPLPATDQSLHPSVPAAFGLLQNRQRDQKKKHDKTARPLQPLKEGETVLVRTDKEPKWTPGLVLAEHKTPRSYIVDQGTSIVRRNRVHLKLQGQAAVGDDSSDHTRQTTPDRDYATPPEVSRSTPPSPEPTATPRRSVRENRGRLPGYYRDFDMK